MKSFRLQSLMLITAFLLTLTTFASASAAEEKLDRECDAAMAKFYKEVKGAEEFIGKVKGYLVFPKITKAGFVLGGSHGEGALRINGETKYYYSVTSGSIGYQLGVQQHSMVIAFLSEASLNNFINSNGWEAGVDGTIGIDDKGISKDLTSMSYEKPIVAFIFGEKGLMGSLSIEGNKFQKIVP